MENPPLLLLPRPRQLRVTGAKVALGALPVTERMDARWVNLPGPEAYRLEIRADGITLDARTPTGLRWARATLDQLRRHANVPGLVIDDAPCFAQRGVMLDISRDRVPRMDTLFALVDRLASWKINRLQLYVEHALAYEGHQEAWQGASPVTLEELSALNAYAAQRGIALDANQNTLGHCERWLRHPRYASFGERPAGMMVRGEYYVPPNTLCPTDPATLELVGDWLSQQLPLCSGQYANIGCDEPWDLGTGRSFSACQAHGKATVYSEYVSQVSRLVRNLGKRPQFWCDPEPHENDALPDDLVALVWEYEAGNAFAPRVDHHRSCGREAWVVPGTSCWNSSTGRTWNRRDNLDRAAEASEATGFLAAAWGDEGHRQPWPVTLLGLADAAMTAWSGPGHYDDCTAGLHCFDSPELGTWLSSLGNCDRELCGGIQNSTALWREMQANLFERPASGDIAAWHDVRDRLKEALASLPDIPDRLVAEECRFAVELAQWSADRAILRRGVLHAKPRQKLAARMVELIASYRRQWLVRSRPGGLNDSAARFEQLVRQW